MSLITDISTIVAALYPASDYHLSSKFQGNETTYNTTASGLPVIILDNELPKDNSIQQNNNVLKDSRILISVLDLDSTNNTDAQSEAVRATCEAIADRIATRLYQELPVRPSGNQRYRVTPLFHVYAQNLTGVALEMNVNYNEIVNF